MESTNFIPIPAIYKTIVLTKIKVSIFELRLYEYVRVSVIIYDENEIPRDNRLYLLNSQDYDNWASNDDYIIEYVTKKLSQEIF